MEYLQIKTEQFNPNFVTKTTDLNEDEYRQALNPETIAFMKQCGGKELSKRYYHLSVSPTGDTKYYLVAMENIAKLPSKVLNALMTNLKGSQHPYAKISRN